MYNIPSFFMEGIANKDYAIVYEWWDNLGAKIQKEIWDYWTDEKEDKILQLSHAINSELVEREKLEAHFVDHAYIEELSFPQKEFYEYLVNHEIYLFAEKPFHICTVQKKARECLLKGYIPKDFSCPLKNKACLIKKILNLNPGKSVRITLCKYSSCRLD